jgi:hypothetical protein
MLNTNGVVNLVGTPSNTSFTWPATFGRRHHSLPYNILCDSTWELHPNDICPETPKWESQNWNLYYLKTLNIHIFFQSSFFGACKGILGIYISRPFQWYPKGLIWCLFAFPTKALNIWDSRTNVIPKMRVHLGVIGFHPLHFPPFVKVCLTSKHTFLASWAFALHI